MMKTNIKALMVAVGLLGLASCGEQVSEGVAIENSTSDGDVGDAASSGEVPSDGPPSEPESGTTKADDGVTDGPPELGGLPVSTDQPPPEVVPDEALDPPSDPT